MLCEWLTVGEHVLNFSHCRGGQTWLSLEAVDDARRHSVTQTTYKLTGFIATASVMVHIHFRFWWHLVVDLQHWTTGNCLWTIGSGCGLASRELLMVIGHGINYVFIWVKMYTWKSMSGQKHKRHNDVPVQFSHEAKLNGFITPLRKHFVIDDAVNDYFN